MHLTEQERNALTQLRRAVDPDPPLHLYFVERRGEKLGCLVVAARSDAALDVIAWHGLEGWDHATTTFRAVQRNVGLTPQVVAIVPLEAKQGFRDHSTRRYSPTRAAKRQHRRKE